jgi:hypothetical protein
VKTKLAAALSGAALIVITGSLAGCGSDTNEKLNAWAKTVCDQASAQVKKINAANVAITQVDSGGTPADVQSADAAAFQQISDAYKALAGIVSTAGDPPVDKGKALRAGTVSDLNRLAASYAELKQQVDALDTKDQANFADGLQTVSDHLGKVSKTGGQALNTLRQGEVGKAMAGQTGCQSTGAASPVSSA